MSNAMLKVAMSKVEKYLTSQNKSLTKFYGNKEQKNERKAFLEAIATRMDEDENLKLTYEEKNNSLIKDILPNENHRSKKECVAKVEALEYLKNLDISGELTNAQRTIIKGLQLILLQKHAVKAVSNKTWNKNHTAEQPRCTVAMDLLKKDLEEKGLGETKIDLILHPIRNKPISKAKDEDKSQVPATALAEGFDTSEDRRVKQVSTPYSRRKLDKTGTDNH